ncbi:MAG TPA: DUF503 domain-containing protein [Syntrophorhabdaceae bacterium]|jgi:hypothetical protein
MIVGVSTIEMFFSENHSLKDKRQTTTKIVEKIRTRFNISVMEVEQTNLWQRVEIAFAIVGVKKDHVEAAIENVHRFVESLYVGEIINTRTEIIMM